MRTTIAHLAGLRQRDCQRTDRDAVARPGRGNRRIARRRHGTGNRSGQRGGYGASVALAARFARLTPRLRKCARAAGARARTVARPVGGGAGNLLCRRGRDGRDYRFGKGPRPACGAGGICRSTIRTACGPRFGPVPRFRDAGIGVGQGVARTAQASLLRALHNGPYDFSIGWD